MYLLFFEHLCFPFCTHPSLFFLLSVHSAVIVLLSCSHEIQFAENGLCPVLSSVLRIFPVFNPPLFYFYYYLFLVCINPLAICLAFRFLFAFSCSVFSWCFLSRAFFSHVFWRPSLVPSFFLSFWESPGTEIIFYTRFV
jgi:hypothetical protein